MNLIRLVPMIFSILLLGACATPQQQTQIEMLLVPEDGSQLPPTKGIVMLRVADASPFIPLRLNYVTFAPKDAHAGATTTYYRTESLYDNGVTSSTYFTALPAGQYSIESMRSFHQFGQFFYSNFVHAGVQLGTFTVAPGEVTNLGTVIFYPRNSGAKNYVKLLRTHSLSDEAARALLVDHMPQFAASLPQGKPFHTWDVDGLDDQRAIDYSTAAHSVRAYNTVVRLPGNQLSFPSRMGTILYRDGDKQWHQDSLDGDNDILAYARTTSGVEIIAGEYGQFCYREHGKKDFTDIKAPSNLDPVVNVAIAPNGTVYAVTRNLKQLTVFSTESIKNPEWKKITDVKLSPSDPLIKLTLPNATRNIIKWDFLNTDDAIYISVTDIFPDQSLYRLAFKDGALKEIKSPVGIFSTNFPSTMAIQNGVLYIYHPGMTSDDLYKSTDGGEHWQNAAGLIGVGLNLTGMPHFWDDNRVFAIHKKRGVTYDGKPMFDLQRSQDGGLTWTALANTKLPDGCNTLIPEIGSGKLLLFCPSSGNFYLSMDAGTSWLDDRTVELQ